MDHYKVLGIQRNASKQEIKQAFRELAMRFHPDKHSQSSDRQRDSATRRFKQLSEAYETLIDDRKRADYNLNRNTNSYGYADHHHHHHHRSSSSHRSYSNPYGYGYGYSARRSGGGDGLFNRFEIGIRYLTTKSFLLNATCFGLLLGGMYIVDASGKALWEMRNHGKSFEDAMESVEKAKAHKDNS